MRKLILLGALAALLFVGGSASGAIYNLCKADSAAELANCQQTGVNQIVYTTVGTLATGTCSGGTDEMFCICEDGGTCLPAVDDAGLGFFGNCITLNGSNDQVCNAANNTFTFTADTASDVTITCADDDATAGCIYDAGGASPIIIGSANVTQITADTDGADLGLDDVANTLTLTATTTASAVFAGADAAAPANTILDTATTGTITIGSADVTDVIVDSDAGLTFAENDESISNSADGTFLFTREETGVVLITTADDDAAAQMTIQPGGASPMQLGGADTTQIDLQSDSDYNLINTSSNSVALHFRDYGDSTDDDMAHASVIGNCPGTGAGVEECDMRFNYVTGGVADEFMRMNAVDSEFTVDTVDGTLSYGAGNLILSDDTDGGNGDGLLESTQNYFVGIPSISGFSLGQGNDGSETVNVDFGDSETPDTDWAQTANITTSDENTIIKMGTGSLELLVGATPADGNGADCALATGNQDWTDDASFGMWMRCDELTDATMWVLEIHDTGPVTTELVIPAVPVADHWTWVEVDVSGLANASKDDIDTIAIDLTAAGAAAMDTQTCYFDYMFKWDDAEELAMNIDIKEDGILSMFSMIVATANNRIPILEVEGTDYFVHYEGTDDFIVPISDLSADALWGSAALDY